MISFAVPGIPRGKGRPRFNGKYAYTPKETVYYENLVKLSFIAVRPEGWVVSEKPVSMTIKAYYQPPKSTSNKMLEMMLNGNVMPCKKPDADNIAKIISDALNGIAYRDDAQIVRQVVEKHYAKSSEVLVFMEEYDYEKELITSTDS